VCASSQRPKRVCLYQVSLVLSYSSVHCLDGSGVSVDVTQLHFLHLVTVAHMVQILLTSVPGTNAHTHTHSLTLTLSHTHTDSLSHTHSHTLSLSLSPTLSLSLSLSLFLSPSLSLSLTHSLSLSFTHSLSFSLPLSLSLSLEDTDTSKRMDDTNTERPLGNNHISLST